jgi:hypothetical protein
MARFDKDTVEFMSKVSEDDNSSEEGAGLTPLRKVRQVIKSIGNPQRAIGKAIVGEAVSHMLEKEGGISPFKVYQFLNDHYKKEWKDWEPETLWQMMKEQHDFDPTPELRNIVMAIQTSVTTNAPFEHWHIFEKVGHALSCNHVNFRILQPLEADEAARAIRFLRTVRPKQDFENEVYVYLAAVAKNCGIVYMPQELFGKTQEYLDEFNNDIALKNKISSLWPNVSFKTSEESVRIQIERLKEIKEAVEGMV